MESVALIWSMHIAAQGKKETGKIALASNPGWQFKRLVLLWRRTTSYIKLRARGWLC